MSSQCAMQEKVVPLSLFKLLAFRFPVVLSLLLFMLAERDVAHLKQVGSLSSRPT